VTPFGEVLREVSRKLPDARALFVMDRDGIAVEKLLFQTGDSSESLAAEVIALLRSGGIESADTGLGGVRDVTIGSGRLRIVVSSITADYFLLAVVGPEALLGRAKFVLRLAGMAMEKEFL
jgi:predicted regulator of Ras-like GTPase activity (Roadblock/LC7/MglB family)